MPLKNYHHDLKTELVFKDFLKYMQKKILQLVVIARQNFAVAGLALPALSYPVSYGLATVLGISTAGGAKVLGERVTNYLKDNPQILEDPRFKAAALAFGITPSGLVRLDQTLMKWKKQEKKYKKV